MLNPLFEVFHNFFFFLSTQEGILFRAAIELIIFALVTYMIFSEFLRERITDYKYLLSAFASLAIQRLIIVCAFGFSVFGSIPVRIFEPFLPVALHFLEAFAFILLANAFVFPYKKQKKRIVSTIEIETSLLCILTVVIQLIWLQQIASNPNLVFTSFWGYILLNLFKIIILAYPIFFIMRFKHSFRHAESIMLAFTIFAAVPLIQSISVLRYGFLHPKTMVFLNPFPFFATLLFTKAIYLKLVDKANLKIQLKESREKYKAAKEVGEMKDRFVSVVSHELRTPLTSMKLFSKLLLQGKFGKVNKKQEKAITVISSETDRLSELINDILHLSKLESKKSALKIEAFNFHKFAKDHHLYELARQKGIAIKIDIPKNFTLHVDADKFKLVFINLLSNAIKFTGKEGSITISTQETQTASKIAITDTGKGISQKDLPHLFEKFYQVEGHMTRNVGGTGLGLAIAKKVVNMHKGDIHVTSQIGKGSKFTVEIPKTKT